VLVAASVFSTAVFAWLQTRTGLLATHRYDAEQTSGVRRGVARGHGTEARTRNPGGVTELPCRLGSDPSRQGSEEPECAQSGPIRRVVSQNFSRFRLCYKAGTSRGESEARVDVRFAVGSDGSVSEFTIEDSTLADPRVTRCVARSFYGLQLANPERRCDGEVSTIDLGDLSYVPAFDYSSLRSDSAGAFT